MSMPLETWFRIDPFILRPLMGGSHIYLTSGERIIQVFCRIGRFPSSNSWHMAKRHMSLFELHVSPFPGKAERQEGRFWQLSSRTEGIHKLHATWIARPTKTIKNHQDLLESIFLDRIIISAALGRFRLFGLLILREWSRCDQLSHGIPAPFQWIPAELRHKDGLKSDLKMLPKCVFYCNKMWQNQNKPKNTWNTYMKDSLTHTHRYIHIHT